jgi:hypothetical protein
MKYLQAIISVDVALVSSVRDCLYRHRQPLMTETQIVFGTSGTNSTLTPIIAPEDFTVCCLRESIKLNKITHTAS